MEEPPIDEATSTTNTDIQGGATMASDDGSAVQSQVHDNHHWVDPRQLYADANSTPSSRKSAPPGNLPAVVTPILYDLFLKS